MLPSQLLSAGLFCVLTELQSAVELKCVAELCWELHALLGFLVDDLRSSAVSMRGFPCKNVYFNKHCFSVVISQFSFTASLRPQATMNHTAELVAISYLKVSWIKSVMLDNDNEDNAERQ